MKDTKYALINGIILDGTEGMTPQHGRTILVEGEKIAAIVPQGTDLTGYTVVDLGGAHVMPGLVNLHVHLPAGGKPEKPGKKTDSTKLAQLMTSNPVLLRAARTLCEGYAKTEVLSGVTTLRTVGGIAALDTAIRDRIAAGKTVGPRILASNMAISVPGGHMAGSVAYPAQSVEEVVSLVGKLAGEGVDLIKLMITGGVLDATVKGEPGVLKMPPAYVKAACDEAHRLGLKVAAHVESPEGVRVALENGVDSIEHGAQPDEDILRLFRERQAFHVATLSPALPYALFDRSVSHITDMEQYNGKVVFEGGVACAKACLAAGIPVGLGTDTGCPYTTHYDMWRELWYFHRYCGASNSFALYTGTCRNAQLAGLGEVTGVIKPGMSADLIVCAGDPLQDLRVLRKLDLVMARGKLYRHPKVKKMPEVERELDKFL